MFREGAPGLVAGSLIVRVEGDGVGRVVGAGRVVAVGAGRAEGVAVPPRDVRSVWLSAGADSPPLATLSG